MLDSKAVTFFIIISLFISLSEWFNYSKERVVYLLFKMKKALKIGLNVF